MDIPIQVDLGRIAQDLQIRRVQVESVVQLLDEGNTVPFITRYRKERTGGLDERIIREIQSRVARQRELSERKETILRSIEQQGKLSDELREAILAADGPKRLEDLYLPFKPKKKTKASEAREKGFEPLALRIWNRDETLTDLQAAAREFLNPEKGVETVEQVLEGVGHILSESINELAPVREAVRRVVWRAGKLMTSKLETVAEGQGLDFRDYFEYTEPINHVPPHRVLAINRGEKENILRLRLDLPRQEVERALFSQLPLEGHPHQEFFTSAALDALDRLLLPSLEREVKRDLTEVAERHAVDVFARNLRSLLLQPPIGKQTVLAIDPGFRTGCKIAVLDAYGTLLDHDVIHPHQPQNRRYDAKQKLKDLIGKHRVSVVAIGNGTACRETEELIAEVIAEGTFFHQNPGATEYPGRSGRGGATQTAETTPSEPAAGSRAAGSEEGTTSPLPGAADEPALSESSPEAVGIVERPTHDEPSVASHPQQSASPSESESEPNSQGAEVSASVADEQNPPITGGSPEESPDENDAPPPSSAAEAEDSESESKKADLLESSNETRNPAAIPDDDDEKVRPIRGGSPDEDQPDTGATVEETPVEETTNESSPTPSIEDHVSTTVESKGLVESEPTAAEQSPGGETGTDAAAGEAHDRVMEPDTAVSRDSETGSDRESGVVAETALNATAASDVPPPQASSVETQGETTDATSATSQTGIGESSEAESATEPPPAAEPTGGEELAVPPAADFTHLPAGPKAKSPGEKPPRPQRSKQPPPPPKPHPADEILARLSYVIVNEAGASVYSASPVGREEFPELDATTRGTVSIGRRLQDPLSELVKIEPQNIGVGLYQHDVNPKHLKESLDTVIESCVNFVGVDLNTASVPLLRHVSGLNALTARRLADRRKETGPFTNRDQVREIEGIGDKVFTQAAGFLKIRDGENPLDRTWIHPESYEVATRMLESLGFSTSDILDKEKLAALNARLAELDIPALARELNVGEPTLHDICEALARPDRDPREDLPKPIFKRGVLKLEDLHPEMELKGTVLNVVDFGAFVDIGLKDSGLVHISQLANRYIKSPHDVVSVGDVVTVWVLGVDPERKRVSLSMVQPGTERPRAGGGRRGGGEGSGAPRGEGPPRERETGPRPEGGRRGGGPRSPRGEGRPSGPAGGGGGGGAPAHSAGEPAPTRGARIPGPPQRAQQARRGGPRRQGAGARLDRPPMEERPSGPPKPKAPPPPPPPLSKEAITGNAPLRTFGQLKQLFEMRTQAADEGGTAGEAPQASNPTPSETGSGAIGSGSEIGGDSQTNDTPRRDGEASNHSEQQPTPMNPSGTGENG